MANGKERDIKVANVTFEMLNESEKKTNVKKNPKKWVPQHQSK